MTQCSVRELLMEINSTSIEFLLTHLLRKEHLFNVATAVLTPAHFDLPTEVGYRCIWHTTQAYYQENRHLPNHNTLSMIVVNRIQSDRSLGPLTLNHASDFLARVWGPDFADESSFHPQAAMEVLQGLLFDREVEQPLRILVHNYGNHKITDLSTQVAAFHQRTIQIEAMGQPNSHDLEHQLPAYRERVARRRGRSLVGLRTGMPILDDRFCGMRGLTIFGAGPGVGKTVYAIQVALGVCRFPDENHAAVVYVSLDMPTDDVIDRIYCNLSGLDWKTYCLGNEAHRSGQSPDPFTPEQLQLLERAEQQLATLSSRGRLRIVGRERSTRFSSIGPIIQAAKTSAGADRCLVVVDYLQLIGLPEQDRAPSDLEADKARVRLVQDLLDTNPGTAALVISEARKPTNVGTQHWGGQVADLMGSARLGYAADAVLLMRRPEDKEFNNIYPSDVSIDDRRRALENTGVTPLLLSLEKGRDGMTRGQWPVEFQYRHSRIVEMEQGRSRETVRLMSIPFLPPPARP